MDAIEGSAEPTELSGIVSAACDAALAQLDGRPPERAILGCTHYPIVEHLFAENLPPSTRIMSQPSVVADSLDDYLHRHPHYATPSDTPSHSSKERVRILTTGTARHVNTVAVRIWPGLGTIELVS